MLFDVIETIPIDVVLNLSEKRQFQQAIAT